ncbi:hypothetical protein JH26_10750 [Microvirga sp. BSC39]|nr:hypothetical protein JH26_10750 [Microvirga sp. BSC39]
MDVGLPVCSSTASAPDPSALLRYYFNLTDGETVIWDQEGVEASSLQAAVISAMEAVEELRSQDASNSDEWQGWRLEIVDAAGRAVQSIPLDSSASR